jgi:hypothetical protein
MYKNNVSLQRIGSKEHLHTQLEDHFGSQSTKRWPDSVFEITSTLHSNMYDILKKAYGE